MDKGLEVVAIFFLASLAAVVLAGVTAYVAVRRFIVKRWRRYVGAAGTAGLAFQLGHVLMRSALSRPWWTTSWRAAQADRAKMWRAVTGARRAVDQAHSLGAPVGELPRRTKDLQAAAHDLDRLLSMHDQRTSVAGGNGRTKGLVDDLIGASGDVRAAAMDAMEHASWPQASAAVMAASDEARAVRAGVAVITAS